MNILLLGSGGREHAFSLKLSQSPNIKNLWIAPGNAGTEQCGKNINLSPLDFSAIKKFVYEKKINIVLVGPEDPLVHGIHDYFLEDTILKKVKIIGPAKQGAMLEGSKDFAKAFMGRHNIPTAPYRSFSKHEFDSAVNFIKNIQPPFVIKADGLAAGKGVIICDDLNVAKETVEDILKNSKFGKAGNRIVIEKFLEGIELSVFVVTDGKSYKILPEAKDYKRIGEGDTGPNTGGMGAISPVPFADDVFMKKVEEKIINPTIAGLIKENIKYKGFLFIGLMNVNGEPYVIEYNVRMGDPETEVVIPRIKSDIIEILTAIADEKLDSLNIEVDNRTAAAVMLVSQGYPGNYEKGKVISNIEKIYDSIILHAGTAKDSNGNIVTNGGRVIAIVSLHQHMKYAIENSLNNAEKINFEGKFFRRDIGQDILKYLNIKF